MVKYMSKYEEMVNELLPAIRKFLAIELKELMSQKAVAKLMGLTEGAISQYVNSKRGFYELNGGQKAYLKIQANKIYETREINYDKYVDMCWSMKNEN